MVRRAVAGSIVALLIVGASSACLAGPNVPEPPARPEGIDVMAPSPPGSQPAAPSEPEGAEPPGRANLDLSGDAACKERLHNLGVVFEPAEARQEGECGIAAPVAVTGLSGGIVVRPAATLTCEAAEDLARWAAEAVVPAAAKALDARPTVAAVAGSYVCRGRNGVKDAPLSEHALGTAIDIAGFEFGGRQSIAIVEHPGDSAADVAFRAAIRRAACSYFTTVLGPGSDAEHSDHLHMDIKIRTNGYRICE